jgi:hypothetical protein
MGIIMREHAAMAQDHDGGSHLSEAAGLDSIRLARYEGKPARFSKRNYECVHHAMRSLTACEGGLGPRASA